MKRHPKSSHASSTPATDGKHVACIFGSEGLFCFTVEGKLLWRKSLGVLDSGYYVVPSAQWGFASSPIIQDGRVVVQCDVQTNSFLAAFDVRDGKELWRTPRAEVPTWSTPTVAVHGGRAQVIVNGYKHIGGYDLATGNEIWKLRGVGDIPVPTPVVADDLVFITNAHGRMAPIYAIRLGAIGDISLVENQTNSQHIAWSLTPRGNYMQTPMAVGDFLYCCNDAGVLACISPSLPSDGGESRLPAATATAQAGGEEARSYGLPLSSVPRLPDGGQVSPLVPLPVRGTQTGRGERMGSLMKPWRLRPLQNFPLTRRDNKVSSASVNRGRINLLLSLEALLCRAAVGF